jgi:hypothetical protein
MSLLTIISRIETERALNQTLLESLLESIDADIARLQEKKQNLIEEFAERDVSLLRIIDGEPPMAVDTAPATPALTGHSDDVAQLAA